MKIKNKSQGENENNSKTNSKLTPFKKGLVVSVMSAGILFGSMGMLAGCGEQGPQGEQGIQGEQGVQGPQGEAGTDGATWLTGTAITGTESSITATVDGAKIGDLYLNITTCDIYQCTAENTWKWIANIKGEQGEPGENGENGENGTTPTITINSDGFWVINGIVTDVNARGDGTYGNQLISIPVEESYFKNKKLVFLGDSITAGTGASSNANRFTSQLSTLLQAEEFNMGIGGTTFGDRLDSDTYTDLKDIPTDADYIIISLGTNDYGSNVPLGVLGDTNTSTIYGLVEAYCSYLTQNYSNSKIIFLTPINRGGISSTTNNHAGYSLRDVCTAITSVTSKYKITTMDMNVLSGIYYEDDDNNNTTVYLPDGIHPNDNGHLLMANALKDYLLQNYNYYNSKDINTIKFTNTNEVIRVLDNSTYVLPTPIADDGEIFIHWVCSNGELYSGGSTISVKTDITLSPLFAPDQGLATITVHTNGGSSNYTNIPIAKGTSLSENDITLTATHTSFGLKATWYQDENFTIPFDENTTVEDNIDIYAYWETDAKYFVYDSSSPSTIIGFSNELINNADTVTKIVLPKYATDNETAITTLNGGSSVSSSIGRSVSGGNLFTNIDSLVIPDGYTTLTQFFFVGSNSSAPNMSAFTVEIGKDVNSIDLYFCCGVPVREFIVDDLNTTFSDLNGMLISNENNRTTLRVYNNGNGETDIVIPDEVVRVYNNTFVLNTTVQKITFGKNLLINNYLYSGIIAGTGNTLTTLEFTTTTTANIPPTMYNLFSTFSTSAKIFTSEGKIIVANETMREYIVNNLKAVSDSNLSTELKEAITSLADRVEIKSS